MRKIKYDKKESICACKVSLDILGDKWSLIIVRDIFREKYTFSEFLNESDEGISSSILVDRLKKLISLEIINFIREPEDKKIKKYYLTDRGIELYGVIYELQFWTINNVDFNHSTNTTKWKKFTSLNSKEQVISHYQNSYRKLRLKTFNL
ncbi:MAG: putative HTH-type transcriptional regulator [Flavobacteriaceae bacterium]|nr:MAG: putative HTH-type transcriptional regulator [Flavobacteriaceae bacterium]|tara:strand:- start:109 stop:558 length:450 start_codon:yes stop_codon:yes gene_type:complete